MRSTLLAIGLALLGGCGTMPAATMLALGRVDAATTDLAALQAAIDMPDALRPVPGSARLSVRIDAPGGSREGRFMLEPDGFAAARAARDAPPGAGRGVLGFRLTSESLAALAAFRQTERPRHAARMTISLAADACRAGDLPPGPLMVTTLLRTQETGRFVVLTRLDLRRLVGAEAIAALPACGAVAAAAA